MPRQIEQGLEAHHIRRTRSHVGAKQTARIGDSLFVSERHMQVGIGGTQLPPGPDLPGRCDLCSQRMAENYIGIGKHEEDHGRSHRLFGERRTVALQVVVVVIERGEIDVEVLSDLSPVSSFIANQLLGFQSGISLYQEINGWRGRRLHENCKPDVLIQSRRGAHRSRYRAPHGLMWLGRPQYSPAGLPFEATEVVMFEFGPYRRGQLVAYDRELVLDESTVDVVDLLVWQEIYALRGLDEIAWAYACAHAPRELLIAVDAKVLDEIHVERVARLAKFQVL